jgi:uncharacterized protein (DUF2235 family)
MNASEPVARKRRLALFLDGTWNTQTDNTNVWRLRSLCPQSSEQLVYYSAGVGTQRGEKLSGGAFGIGINEEVIAAYQWLMENYQDQDHDRIYIFGFSRGAFTARSLAGFISKCGLLRGGSPLSLNQLYSRYRKGDAPSIRALAEKNATTLGTEERWLKKYSRPIPLWFQGVWDTVGTLGIPFSVLPRVSRRDFAFLETDLRINDTYAFHALAIDEHRRAFKPTLWTKVSKKEGENFEPRTFAQVEQRWFVGAHANVGGGYENDLLAQAPLRWIATKAIEHGLTFKGAIDLDEGAAECPVRDSFAEMAHGLYRLASFGIPYLRTIGAPPVETSSTMTENINESIDASVFERCRQEPGYRPKNLAEWAQRRGVQVESLTSAVKCSNPTEVLTDSVPPAA